MPGALKTRLALRRDFTARAGGGNGEGEHNGEGKVMESGDGATINGGGREEGLKQDWKRLLQHSARERQSAREDSGRAWGKEARESDKKRGKKWGKQEFERRESWS